jgi:hypothetical protein
MGALDIVAWFLFIVLLAAAVVIALELAALPGKIAAKRKHPWTQAVNVAGWVTFFLGFALWPLVLIWAYVDAPAAARMERPQ